MDWFVVYFSNEGVHVAHVATRLDAAVTAGRLQDDGYDVRRIGSFALAEAQSRCIEEPRARTA